MAYRVVAWINDQEWMEVYSKLFYESPEEQLDALDILNVWRIRFADKIPVAIEATSVLMEAWVKHMSLSESAQKLMLASAVMQFVGLITERGLKGIRRPIHLVGIELNIPEWVINLRHDMAHGPLPSKLMLTKAVLFGLDWLKQKHWDLQYQIMQKAQAPNKNLDQTQTSNEILKNNDVEEVDESEHISDFLQLLKLFFSFSHEVSNGNLSAKIHANHTADKITSKVLKCPGSIDYLCKIFIEGNYLSYQPKQETEVENNSLKPFLLTDACISFWKPIFQIFKTNSCFPKLLLVISVQLFDLNIKLQNHVDFRIPCIYYAYAEWATYIINTMIKQYGQTLENVDEKSMVTLRQCLKILHLNSDKFSTKIYKKLAIVKAVHSIDANFNTFMKVEDKVIHSIDDFLQSKTVNKFSENSTDTEVTLAATNIPEQNKQISQNFSSCIGVGDNQTCQSLTESLFNFQSKTEQNNANESTEMNVEAENRFANYKEPSSSNFKGGQKVPNMFDSFSPTNWNNIFDSV